MPVHRLLKRADTNRELGYEGVGTEIPGRQYPYGNKEENMVKEGSGFSSLIERVEALKSEFSDLKETPESERDKALNDAMSALDSVVHHLLDISEDLPKQSSLLRRRRATSEEEREEEASRKLKALGLSDIQIDDAIAGYGSDLNEETLKLIKRDYLPKQKTSSPQNIQDLYQLTNQIGSLFGALLGNPTVGESEQEEAEEAIGDVNDLLASVLGQFQGLLGGSEDEDFIEGEVIEDEKQSSIKQHKDPKMLPPRDENRKHYDSEVQKELEMEKEGGLHRLARLKAAARKRAIDYTQVIKEMTPTDAKLLKIVKRKSGQDPVQAIYPFSGMTNVKMFIQALNNLIRKGWVGSKDNKPVSTEVTEGLIMAYDAAKDGAVVAATKSVNRLPRGPLEVEVHSLPDLYSHFKNLSQAPRKVRPPKLSDPQTYWVVDGAQVGVWDYMENKGYFYGDPARVASSGSRSCLASWASPLFKKADQEEDWKARRDYEDSLRPGRCSLCGGTLREGEDIVDIDGDSAHKDCARDAGYESCAGCDEWWPKKDLVEDGTEMMDGTVNDDLVCPNCKRESDEANKMGRSFRSSLLKRFSTTR